MDKFDRIFQLHAILSSRRTAIALDDLMARLECSKSTLHRTINALKDYLNAPVVFDANAGGYTPERIGRNRSEGTSRQNIPLMVVLGNEGATSSG